MTSTKYQINHKSQFINIQIFRKLNYSLLEFICDLYIVIWSFLAVTN